jgi:hypothetical protein
MKETEWLYSGDHGEESYRKLIEQLLPKLRNTADRATKIARNQTIIEGEE